MKQARINLIVDILAFIGFVFFGAGVCAVNAGTGKITGKRRRKKMGDDARAQRIMRKEPQ